MFSAKTVRLTSASDASVAGTLFAKADLTTRIAGTLRLTSTGVLQAGSSDASGNVTSTGSIVLGAGTVITNAGTIVSTGDLTFDTPSLVNTGTIYTGSDINLTAANLSLGGTFVSLGNMTVSTSAGALDVSGGLEGRNVSLSAIGGDLTLDAGSHLTAYGDAAKGAGVLSLTSSGAINALGTIAANNDVRLDAGTSIHIGADRGGTSPTYALATAGNVTLIASGALVNDGTVQAGKTLTLSGASLTSNNLLTGGALAFTTPGNILLTGTTYGAGGVSLGSTGGTLSLASTAALQSPGAITLSSAGDLTNAGIISAGASGSGTSGSSAAGAITLASTGALTSTGAIVSNNDSVSLAGTSITLGGALSSNGGVYAAKGLSLNAPSLDVLAGGQFVANDTLTFAGTSLSLGSGSLLQSNKDVRLTLGVPGHVGSYTSAGNLVALGDLALTVTGGTIANQAGSGIFAGGSGSTRTGGAITLAAASLDNAGLIVASADASGSNTNGAGNVTITAPTVTNTGLIHADQTLALATSSLFIDGSLASASNGLGTMEAGGAINWSIPTLVLTSGGGLKSAGNITLASATLANGGSILAGGDLAITTSGDLTSTGRLATPGTLRLASGTLVTLSSASQTWAGSSQAAPAISTSSITLSAPAIEALGTLAATGSLGVAADSFAVGGSTIANGDLTLAGYTTGTAPTLTITAGGELATYLGNARLGTLAGVNLAGALIASNGDVSFTSPSTTIAATGKLAAGGNALISTTGVGALSVAGQILASQDVVLTGGTLGVGSTGLVQAGHDLRFTTSDTATGAGPLSINGVSYDVTGTPISARIAGKLSAGHDLSLVMPGVLLVDGSGQLVAAHDISLTAGHALIGARYTTDASGNPLSLGVIAGHDVHVSNSPALGGLTARGLMLDGSIQAGNNLSINASGEVTTTAASQLVAGNALGIYGSALGLSGLNSGQTLVSFTATGATPAGVVATLTPGDITLAGATASNGRVALAANTATITATGSITTYGGSGNSTAVGRNIGGQANIDLETTGDLTNNGAIWSDGVVFLKSASGRIINNASGANGGITAGTIVTQADAGSFVNQAGAFKADNAGLFLGGDFINTGSFTPSGNYWISAANIANSGLLATSGNLTLDAAGNLYNSGTIYSGNKLTLSVGGTLTNDYVGDDQGNGSHGLILAQNDIAITAHDLINQSATIQSLAGNIGITLTGGSLTNTIKSLVIAPVPGTGVQRPGGLTGLEGEEVSALFARVGCGGSGVLSNGNSATFNCFSSSQLSVTYRTPSGHRVSYTLGYYTIAGQDDTTAVANTGSATIAAAADLTVNAGSGSVSNRNSALLAGSNLTIALTGSVSNTADLLIQYVNSGGTQSLVNTSIPGAPTLIQAGGTVAIPVGHLANVANNLVGTDTYSANQVVQFAAPGAPGNSSASTGSTGIGAKTAPASVAAALTSHLAVGGNGAVSSTSGSGLYGQGLGSLLSAGAATTSDSGVTPAVRSTSVAGTSDGNAALLTASTALVGGKVSLGNVAIGNAAGGPGGANPASLVSRVVEGAAGAGGSAALVDGASGGVTANSASLAAVTQGASPISASLVSAFNGAGLPSLSNQGFGTFLGSFLNGFNLNGNSPGLFTYSANPNSAYLFTTTAALSSEAALYDSSYFFGRLATDRATSYTRLGDGFFEAMLVSKQVQAQTGQAQLAEYGSALDQYQGLLQNAATAQTALGLQMGVALTDAQVAELSQSVIWYVSELVDGRNVLVPVVYLAASDKKAIVNGALIAGNNVLISATGSITNSGTIKANQIVALAANGSDLVNGVGGTITGGSVVAQAAHDILLEGGSTISATGAGVYTLADGQSLAGGTVALSAAHDIVTSTVTSTATSASGSRSSANAWASSYTETTSVAGAAITSRSGTLLTAGQDIALNAAALNSAGATSLIAGGDVNLTGTAATSLDWQSAQTGRFAKSASTVTSTSVAGTTIVAGGPISVIALNGSVKMTGASVQTTNPEAGEIDLVATKGVSIASAADTSSLFQFQQNGKKAYVTTTAEAVTNDLSTINAAGALSITTPGALAVNGGTLASEGVLAVNAGSVAVNGVIDSQLSDVATYTKKSGFLSSTTTTTHTVTSDQTAVASTLSGDTVQVTTPGAVNVTGSNVVASNGLGVAAGGPVTIGSLATTDTQDYSVSVKKSGFSFSGTSLFLGVAKTSTDSSSTSTTQNGSLVGTANGDLSIVSGDKLTVTGSQIAAGGDVLLAGKSIDIANALDTSAGNSTTKSSSFGVSIGVSSPIIAGATAAVDMAKVASSSASDRTQAVAALAGGLGAYNAYTAVKGLGDLTNPTNLEKSGALSVSLGFSSSKSTSASTGEAVVGSAVTGNNVTLIANGADAGSTISVTGSSIKAANDLALAATGDINLAAAAANTTQSGTSKSSGASIGVSISTQGIAATASVNGGHGNYSGASTNYTDAVVAAGNVASVSTPGALNLTGGQLSGDQVKVDAGSLAITSLQDTSVYASKSSSFGLGVSVPITGAGKVGVSGSMSTSNENGTFASVGADKHAGIYAGSGGFDVTVAGNTNLAGGVITSTADASNNSLTTGTLSASDIENREQYSASQVSISGGITFGGTSAIFKDNKGTASAQASGSGNPISGVTIGGNTISATPPVAMSASGGQASTTQSAIAQGTITIASGDAASQQVAQTISRDTSAASAALTQQFNDAKRAEIAKGFEAAQTLTTQVGTFLDNRAKEADAIKEKIDAGTATAQEQASYADLATWGAGGAGNLVLTALSGAAGSNVSGSLSGLVQSATVNVLQGLAVQHVKAIADSFSTKTDSQGNPIPNATSETVRFALQALTACAGSAAGGAGDCGGAAMGAATSVVLNNLLSTGTTTATDENGKPLSQEQQQARANLVGTIVAAIAQGAGIDTNAAITAAQIETQNNSLGPYAARVCKPGQADCYSLEQFKRNPDIAGAGMADFIAVLGLTPEEAFRCLTSEEQCAPAADAKARMLKQLAADGAASAQDKARIEGASFGELVVMAGQLKADEAQMAALRQSDPALAERLSQESLAVRSIVYQDAKTNAGDNPVGRLADGVLSAVLSDQQILDMYLANASDRAGESKGALDEALQSGRQKLLAQETAARLAADNQAQQMLASGSPKALVDAYLFKEYYNAAATRETGTGLLGQVQFLGNYLTDPGRVSLDTVKGLAQSLDNVLLDDKSALQHLQDAKQGVVDFANADIRSQATTLGNGAGKITVGLVDAVAAKGAGAVAGRIGVGTVGDATVPLRVAAGVELNPKLPDPVAGVDYAPSSLSGGTAANQLSQFNGYAAELQLANRVADLPGETVVRYGSNVNTTGADIISVNVDGTVTLWDSKFRSNPKIIESSPTFVVDSRTLANAVEQAKLAITASNMPPAVKGAALENLRA